MDNTIMDEVRGFFAKSGYFDSNSQLRSLFVDARLSPWRGSVPEASSQRDRVNFSVAAFDKMNGGKNLLAIIVQVIAERIQHGDALRSAGFQLVGKIQEASTRTEYEKYNYELQELEYNYRQGWAKKDYYDRRKMQLLELIQKYSSTELLPTQPAPKPDTEWLIGEFDAAAKTLVLLRTTAEVYAEFGVHCDGLHQQIANMRKECERLAGLIKNS